MYAVMGSHDDVQRLLRSLDDLGYTKNVYSYNALVPSPSLLHLSTARVLC